MRCRGSQTAALLFAQSLHSRARKEVSTKCRYMKQKNLPQALQAMPTNASALRRASSFCFEPLCIHSFVQHTVRDFISTSWTKNMLFNDDQILSEMSVLIGLLRLRRFLSSWLFDSQCTRFGAYGGIACRSR